MIRVFSHVILLWWISGAVGATAQSSNHGDTESATISSSSTSQVTSTTTSFGTAGLSSKAGNSTCPSQTVNYITHTLPRQCLRTDRVPYNSTAGANTTTTNVDISSSMSISAEPTDIGSGIASNQTIEHASTSGAEATPTTSSTETLTSSAASSSSIEPKPEAAAEDDADSPLDNANFLSFEEWKKQNLAKTGQSPEDIDRARAANPDRHRPVINNALDSLGDEGEIDLDFTGFGGAAKPPAFDSQSAPSTASASDEGPGGALSRSKDAGKTCKERTNYASFDCSANILKSNKECKSASSVLVENKDSYMLNVCSATNKFFIVELCTDLYIDTIVLANYEFFSSSFRHFRVSVSDKYPVKMEKWRELGTFEARNTREIQAFLVENPLIWAKYLRIEFLTQYGTEYYCPASLLRVHGTTMIEEFRHLAAVAAGEEDEAILEAEVTATPPAAQEPAAVTEETTTTTSEAVASEDGDSAASVTKGPPIETAAPEVEGSTSDRDSAYNSSAVTLDDTGVPKAVGVYEPLNVNLTCEGSSTTSQRIRGSPLASTTNVESAPSAALDDSIAASNSTPDASSSSMGPHTSPSSSGESRCATEEINPSTSKMASEPQQSTNSTTTAPPPGTPTVDSTSTGAENATAVPQKSTQATASTNKTTAVSSSTIGGQSSQGNVATNSTRSFPSSTSAQPAQPSTQESFFKSFHKRLLQLESNSTLSLQYIEEQSRILRDAFTKVEKRQVATTSKFLSQLNETVMTELQGFRQAYDQLWQSTVIELEGQRETYQREMLALSARLTMVADELVWQKRMGIVQSTLLLLCLALVLFGRSSNGYIEMPLMQQMMNRSTAALRAGWESPPNSPSPDSRSPVSLFRRKLWRSSTEPAGEAGNLTDSEVSRPQSKEGPEVLVEPPSPMSHNVRSDLDDEYADDSDSSPNTERQEAAVNQGPTSPKRRKKPKKPSNWPKENGPPPNQRTKSPLAM